jgi:hypothetical protein
MNEYRQQNLEFLLGIGNGKEFDDFVESLPLDDIYYALELLYEHSAEIMVKEIELQDEVKDVSLAVSVINKIKENNNA